uniref:K Homology domain-containing protein n=1 Tax=Panagrolaimus sp. ES5 TaxID=591445 RepID=A0AC34FIV8_9BILA
MVQKSASHTSSHSGKSSENQIFRSRKSASQISHPGGMLSADSPVFHPRKSDSQISSHSGGDDIRHLAALLREKRNLLTTSPSMYPQIQRLVDLEIWRIRQKLFQDDFNIDLQLPLPEGEKATLTEKVFLPCKKHPEVNFVGRIIGPRGQTAKQIETATGCKVMIRGKGSMREGDKSPRARTHVEHLEEDLHVLLHCDDTPNRARVRINKAIDLINKISIPADSGPDDLKRKQLIELAILNGTYRDKSSAESSSSFAKSDATTTSSGSYRERSSPENSPTFIKPDKTKLCSTYRERRSSPETSPSFANTDATTWIWNQLGISTPSVIGGDSPCSRNVNFFNFDL